ncbi:MAG: hypothetical protein GXP45_07795 [bacterium]|nr:hypothetical protein [bacterium]
MKHKFLLKAIFEYSLTIIQQADNMDNTCQQDFLCLQIHHRIAQIIKQKNLKCQTSKQKTLSKEQQQACEILKQGQILNYIQNTGNLIYPLDPQNFIYRRRSDIQDRRIILKQDTKE